MANAILLRPLPVTTFGPSSTAVGDVSYLANDYAGVVWQSAVEASPQFIIDLGADTAIDTLFLFGVQLAPAAATLQVFASTAAAGAGFSPPTWSGAPVGLYAGSVLPISGRGVALWTAPAGFPPAVRYLLLRFAAAGNMAVQVSRVAIGAKVQLSRNFSYGASFGVKDLGSVDFSRRGVLLRTRGAKLRTAQITFSSVRKDEAEAAMKPLFEYLGNTEMFALVTDPSADAQRQNRCYFGPLVGDIALKWNSAGAWEAALNQLSVF